jgi:hypothetical protein
MDVCLGGVIPTGQASNQDLSELVAGTYDVVITDANGSTGGCSATRTVVITQPAAALSRPGVTYCVMAETQVNRPYTSRWNTSLLYLHGQPFRE